MHIPSSTTQAASKRDLYLEICRDLQALLAGETDFVANAANTAALLYRAVPNINWVGFYVARDQELVLGPFQGKPACVRIPFGSGVCGTAAQSAETVVVPNVAEFPGHIPCDPDSKSEIVVPLVSWGRLLGVMDVDSADLNRFDEDDCEGLESIASIFVSASAPDEMPDFNAEASRAVEAF